MTTAVGRDGFPAYTLHQWAKSDRSEPGRIHLLEHHLADVGACFEALLGQPTIRKRLARTGGREDLDRATVSRLSVLAALHDIGKVNMGFQTQIWRPEDLPGGRVPASFRRVGHTRDTVPVLDENGDTETSGWFFPALGFDEMLAWDDRDGLDRLRHVRRHLIPPRPSPESGGHPACQFSGVAQFRGAGPAGVRRADCRPGAGMVPGCLWRQRGGSASSTRLPAHVPWALHIGRLDWVRRRVVRVPGSAGGRLCGPREAAGPEGG